MSEYCQVFSRESFRENTPLYRYSPTTGHFEIGVEHAHKVTVPVNKSHATPSTSKQIEDDIFEYDPRLDPKAVHISPSIFLEHNYCSYPPPMATVISPAPVSPMKPLLHSESSDKNHPPTPPVESASDITKSLDTEIDIEITSDNTNQTPVTVEHSCLLTPVSENNSDVSNSPQGHCSNVDSRLADADISPKPEVVDEFPRQAVEVECEAAEHVEQVTEDSTEVGDKADEKKESIDNMEEEDFVTRCICGFQHDDGYMICCDKCQVWQHVDCMEIERNNIPEEYLCEECAPRRVNHTIAIALQKTKLKNFGLLKKSSQNASPNSSDHSDGENATKGSQRNKKESSTPKRKKTMKSPVVVKKKKTIAKREAKSVKKAADSRSVAEHSTDSLDQSGDLRAWIDEYEEAITNHYSPELRSRISSLKLNGIHSHHKLIGAHQSRPKSKASAINTYQKVLTATCYIPPSHPIIEIRGKYMLPKGGTLSPLDKWKEPFMFDHSIVGPGHVTTDIRVDTTTYGNNARFVRSSCYPNAEIQHCVEKGALHIYIVSTEDIASKCEITLPHRPGAECVFGNKCTLVSPVKKRNRKQILIERSVSKDSYNINNNNYKEFSSRKKLVPAVKATKSQNVPSNEDSEYKVTRRSSILKRTESKGRR